MPDTRYDLLRILEKNSAATQRELAQAMGMSLSKTHCALHALMDRGLVKANRFRRADNKRAYVYKLTPRGIPEKTRMAKRFLARNSAEYEAL